MCPIRLTYGDVGNIEKLEKDRKLMLRPIVTDRTCLVASGTLLEMNGCWGPTSDHFEQLHPIIT